MRNQLSALFIIIVTVLVCIAGYSSVAQASVYYHDDKVSVSVYSYLYYSTNEKGVTTPQTFVNMSFNSYMAEVTEGSIQLEWAWDYDPATGIGTRSKNRAIIHGWLGGILEAPSMVKKYTGESMSLYKPGVNFSGEATHSVYDGSGKGFAESDILAVPLDLYSHGQAFGSGNFILDGVISLSYGDYVEQWDGKTHFNANMSAPVFFPGVPVPEPGYAALLAIGSFGFMRPRRLAYAFARA